MTILFLRDLPLFLGIVAILFGVIRGGKSFSTCVTSDGENPQWFCRVVLNFVGVCLIAFGILGNFTPK